jgi:hypothetical protein
LRDLDIEIDRLQREARQMDADRQILVQRRDNIEGVLVAGTLSARERKTVLERYKRMQSDVLQLESDIRHFELEAARLQGEYDLLNSSHGF